MECKEVTILLNSLLNRKYSKVANKEKPTKTKRNKRNRKETQGDLHSLSGKTDEDGLVKSVDVRAPLCLDRATPQKETIRYKK